MKDYEVINSRLYHKLIKDYPDQCQRVFGHRDCDIEPDFLGFVNVYYHLSKIIPTHFTVIDFGCAYCAQAYYFRNHKRYIGVDVDNMERFSFKNTETRVSLIEDELQKWKYQSNDEVFAICSFVPTNTYRVRAIFKNVFVFYPHGDCKIKLKLASIHSKK